MKSIIIIIVSIGLSIIPAVAQKSCLDYNRLTLLDAEWEKALLESNVDRLESLLAKDFVWIHDHASGVDSRDALLGRASDPNIGASGNPKSRISKDVKTIAMGSTGIVTGFTIVDRGSTKTTYHFMRTYVESDGNCFLLANHTMAIPKKEDK